MKHLAQWLARSRGALKFCDALSVHCYTTCCMVAALQKGSLPGEIYCLQYRRSLTTLACAQTMPGEGQPAAVRAGLPEEGGLLHTGSPWAHLRFSISTPCPCRSHLWHAPLLLLSSSSKGSSTRTPSPAAGGHLMALVLLKHSD